MAERVGDLTMQELEQIIDKRLEGRLVHGALRVRQQGRRDPDLVNRLRRNLIPRSPGVPSALELLREDRDQWYKPT